MTINGKKKDVTEPLSSQVEGLNLIVFLALGSSDLIKIGSFTLTHLPILSSTFRNANPARILTCRDFGKFVQSFSVTIEIFNCCCKNEQLGN